MGYMKDLAIDDLNKAARTKTKKIIVEFDVNDSLTINDLCNVVHDAISKARFEVDEKLDRIGNDRGAALYNTTIHFNDFEQVNLVWRNGSPLPPRRRRNN